MLRANSPQPAPTILLIERPHRRAGSLAPTLLKQGYVLVQVQTFRAAVSRARATNPALIIVDATSFNANGVRLSQRVFKNCAGHTMHKAKAGWAKRRVMRRIAAM